LGCRCNKAEKEVFHPGQNQYETGGRSVRLLKGLKGRENKKAGGGGEAIAVRGDDGTMSLKRRPGEN